MNREIPKTKDYLNCMLEIPPLGHEDLALAIEARAKGDEWARRLLEERFLPQVIPWVQPYRGLGPGHMELIEAGNRALLRGLRQLKPGWAHDAVDFLEYCVVDEIERLVLSRKD